MRRTRRARGFTLLEVMLALAILAIVATTVYGSFSRTLRSRDVAQERIDVVRSGRSAIARIGDDVAAAFYPTPRIESAIFRSLPGGTESLPLDALVLSAVTPRPAGTLGRDSDQRLISYFFPEAARGLGERGRELADDDGVDFFASFGPRVPRLAGVEPERLLRRESMLGTREPVTSIPAAVFLDNVASLELRFHDGNGWTDDWDSEDRVNYRPLPRAVGIDLALYDADGRIHHFTTAVDLPLADPRPGPRRSPDAAPSPRPTTAATR
jgi:prepilin-type N-terminal cleavage/methylation domain-containing protein